MPGALQQQRDLLANARVVLDEVNPRHTAPLANFLVLTTDVPTVTIDVLAVTTEVPTVTIDIPTLMAYVLLPQEPAIHAAPFHWRTEESV